MLGKINEAIWGIPLLVLMLGTGILLTVRTGFVQFRLLIPSVKLFFNRWKEEPEGEGVSSFRALCTALAATVGTGNIAAVAGAIAIGGPGAVFWMWVSGFIGMATKFAEAALAVRYSEKKALGEHVGGPMYIMEKGLGKPYRPLAAAYCVFTLIAVLGVGNGTQVNAVMSAVSDALLALGYFPDEKLMLLLGMVMAVTVWKMVSGGSSKIGAAAEFLVPFASAVYLLLGAGVVTKIYTLFSEFFKIM